MGLMIHRIPQISQSRSTVSRFAVRSPKISMFRHGLFPPCQNVNQSGRNTLPMRKNGTFKLRKILTRTSKMFLCGLLPSGDANPSSEMTASWTFNYASTRARQSSRITTMKLAGVRLTEVWCGQTNNLVCFEPFLGWFSPNQMFRLFLPSLLI